MVVSRYPVPRLLRLRTMAGALLLALLVHFLNVVILVAALHALGRPFEWAASLSVYQFGYVFAFLLPLA